MPTSTKFLQVARCSLFGPGGGSRVGTLELEGAQVHGCGDQRGACVTARDLVPLLDFSDPLNSSVVLTFCSPSLLNLIVDERLNRGGTGCLTLPKK